MRRMMYVLVMCSVALIIWSASGDEGNADDDDDGDEDDNDDDVMVTNRTD